MTQSIQPGRFGESGKPDDAWLAKQENEPILEPELPIIDTHHHLWNRGGWTYLLPELLADLNTATTSSPPSSRSAARCTAPMGRSRCDRSVKPSLSRASLQ